MSLEKNFFERKKKRTERPFMGLPLHLFKITLKCTSLIEYTKCQCFATVTASLN